MTNIPRTMRIEISNVCNERCSICPYMNMKRKKWYMDEAIFEKALQEHSKIFDANLLFPANVWEPLIDTRIYSFIYKAKSSYNYKHIAMFSNATLLSKDNFDLLVTSWLTELMLTLHGLKEDNFKNITWFNDYPTVRNNIINAMRANKEKNMPVKIFLDIYSEYPVDEVNKDEIVHVANECWVKLSILQMKDTHTWWWKINAVRKRSIWCKRIYDQFWVLWNWDIVPCCIDVEWDYLLGNIQEKTLQEIFSDTSYLKLITLEKDKKISDLKLCEYCTIQ